MSLLREYSTSPCVSASSFSAEEAQSLVQAGFLTVSNPSLASLYAFSRPDASSLGTLTSLSRVAHQEASGSLGAVGGESAFHDAGGGGGGSLNHQRASAQGETSTSGQLALDSASIHDGNAQLYFSLPNMGSYLRLVSSARKSLMSLLAKSRYKEAPLDLLRERWNGGIATDDPPSRARQARGEFAGVLPGNTRKWKYFYGINFEWVLRECLGSGLVELFETGSVGKGVRVV